MEHKGTQNGNAAEPSSVVMAQAGDLVSTVEFAHPDPSTPDSSTKDANIDDPDGKKTTDADDEAAKAAKLASDQKGDDDLDKHPRFIQLNQRMKLAEDRALALEAKFTNASKPTGKDTKEEPDYKDVSKMTKEEILDWQTEDPQAYYANILAQAKHEISGDMSKSINKRSAEDAVANTYEQYAKDNDDFDSMWDSGEIQTYMDRNPGHNAISAHMAITGAKTTQAKIDDAVKAAEKKIMDNIKAKRESRVLSSGPSASRSSTESEVTEELKDTKKFGGLASVLARRSLARDKARLGT
jgi:hypothetical protein